MPRISLWKPKKTNDYFFHDKLIRENINMGGTGVYLHKYVGPESGGNETKIDDLLLLENRSRKYEDDIYELRGTYNPATTDLNLSQFGYFIANDTISIMFHLNDMLDLVGRKIMSGDVLELPHLDDSDTLDEDRPVSHRFYAVTDTVHDAKGYGNNWWSHVWQVKAKQMFGPEFNSIEPANSTQDYQMGNNSDLPEYLRPGTIFNAEGEQVGVSCCDNPNSTLSTEEIITEGIIAEAYKNVRFDPKQFDAAHLWIYRNEDKTECGPKNMYAKYPWSGDGIPPDGKQLSGSGIEFPTNLVDGDFYLRTDYDTPRLFMKDSKVWRLIEADMRKIWTGYNKILDTFIDNTSTDVMTDGTITNTRKALSKVVKPRANLHKPKEDELGDNP